MATFSSTPVVEKSGTATAPATPVMIGAQKPQTRAIRVQLNHLILQADLYSHRSKGWQDRGSLQPLLESIKIEGLRNAPEGYSNGDGTYTIVTGHRRVTSLRLLAEDKVDGFAPDMEVQIVELVDSTPLDRLAWSVADNEVRLNLTVDERLAVVKKFNHQGMPEERGAISLGISQKQYQRDLTLIRNQWMLDLVNKSAIPATTAVELLEAAFKKDKVLALKIFLEDWVAERELEIEREGTMRQLKPAEALVKSQLTPDLKRHWLDQLASGKELDTIVKPKVRADLNPSTLVMEIDAYKCNLKTDPLEKIGHYMAKLSQILKDAAPILKSRAAVEGPEGPQSRLLNAKSASPFDEDFLKVAGLQNIVPCSPKPFFNELKGGQEDQDNGEMS